uniref:Uncharacterized protein n=1 Tax=Rhizophora mucronata TaxID=61149 RepID=A0A2P2IIK9_RHIMU
MAVLRARLGITVEMSGTLPASSSGMKPRVLQAWTQARSKVWPADTMTGSFIREPEMGQRNSSGISNFFGCRGFDSTVEEFLF